MKQQLTVPPHGLLWQGTYGAAISAASGSFPGPQTPIPQLFRQGPLSLLISMFRVLSTLPLSLLNTAYLLAAVRLQAHADMRVWREIGGGFAGPDAGTHAYACMLRA